MLFEVYVDFVYDVIFCDWLEFVEEMVNMKDVFDVGLEVCIVKVDIDFMMFIEGWIVVNFVVLVVYDFYNFLLGEVFIVFVEDVVEGEVFFDVLMMFEG